MDLHRWWNGKLKGSRAAGVEVVLKGASVEMQFVVLEKKKNELKVASSGAAKNIHELHFPAGIPVSISVSGKGLIHKRVVWSEGQSTDVLLQKVLPNAKLEDLYVQHTEPVSDHVIVSVVRRSVIDELLEAFSKEKLEIVSCGLGPFCITSILPFIHLEETISEALLLPGHTLTILDGEVHNYAASENSAVYPRLIGNETVNAECVISYAAAASYFIGSDAEAISRVKEQGEEFRQKRIFHLTGAGMLIILFTVLLTNYLVFDHYWKKKQSLEARSSASQGELLRYDALKKEYDEKMSFLSSTGLLEVSRSSYYADRIAMGVPAAIQLAEMNIDPKMKTTGDDVFEFESGVIRIAGNCRQSNELNDWMKTIRKQSWVKGVELINYKQGKTDLTGEFIININID